MVRRSLESPPSLFPTAPRARTIWLDRCADVLERAYTECSFAQSYSKHLLFCLVLGSFHLVMGIAQPTVLPAAIGSLCGWVVLLGLRVRLNRMTDQTRALKLFGASSGSNPPSPSPIHALNPTPARGWHC